MLKQMLKKTLMQKASDLFDHQIYLERTEKLNPVLAKLEAWNQVMRPLSQGKDEEEETRMSEMDM